MISRLLLLCLTAPLCAQWATDINPGDGPELLESVRADLAAIVRAAPDERTALIEAFAEGPASAGIEAVKRFRNPELEELFLRLATHDSWQVRHRALLALEHYPGPRALEAAWNQLEAEEPRLRERALLAAIKLWDKRRAAALSGDDPAVAIARLQAREENLYIQSCLEALQRRLKGKLPVEVMYEEVVVTGKDGLIYTPFLSGMNNLRSLAPGATLKARSTQGGRSAAKLPAASRWVGPLLGFMDEEAQGVGLQPFANLRQNDTVYHTGLDAGACLDGSGFYAIADGVVRFVHAGSDMGTMVVTQHHVGGGETVNAIYMHGGDTAFVKAGEQVEAGQLVCTMGLGFSAENGGHFAHIHFGLYPGQFSATHNYGYRSVKAGLADWLDPAAWLPPRMERSAPLLVLEELEGLDDPALGKALELARDEQYGKAYQAARKVQEGGEAGAAASLIEALEAVIGLALARGKAMREVGYPSDALAYLTRMEKACKGLPGDKELGQRAREWKKDKAFKEALRGELEVQRTAALEADVHKKGGKEAVVQLWQQLLEKHRENGLAPRIQEIIDRWSK